MRTQILTDEQRKEHKKNWNSSYYGSIGYALSQMRYFKRKADRLISEHDSPIMEQARQYIDEFAISEDSKVEFFGTVGNFIAQLVDTSTAHDLIQLASDKSGLDAKMFQNFIAREGIEGTSVIIKSEDKRAELLKQAISELKAFERKYNSLAELTDVFNAISKITV